MNNGIEINFSQLNFNQRFEIIWYILLGRPVVFHPIENVSKIIVQQPTTPTEKGGEG